MKAQIRYCLIAVFLFGSFLSAKAQSSPQGALEELATTEKFENFVKHLPFAVEQHIAQLSKPEREALADKLMVSKSLKRDGGTLTRSDSGTAWELMQKAGGEKITFTFKNTYTAGDAALVEMEVAEKNHAETMFIGMHLEENEWRLEHFGQWQKNDVAKELLRTQRNEEKTDTGGTAASTLRTINTCIVMYSSTFPEQGFPMTLQALSGQENDPISPDHAKLLDPSYLQAPVIKSGYEFRYTRLDGEHYQITATPVEPGNGMKSFFTDETASIHATTESREANASDPPLD